MEPSFSHLLDSNHAPSPLELVAIQKEIDACGTAISELQLEAQRTDEAGHEEDGKLWELGASMKKYQQLLTCMRRMPPEILGEMFKAALDPDDMYHIPQLVISICLVCKDWRDAAIGTPGLWNKLQLIRGRPICFTKVGIWFSRAGTLPRYMHLNIPSACKIFGVHPATCDMLTSGLVQFLTDGPALHHLSLSMSSQLCLVWLANHMKKNISIARRPWDRLQSLGVTVTHNDYRVSQRSYLDELIPNLPMVTMFHLQEIGYYSYGPVPSSLHMLADFFDNITVIHVGDWPLSWMQTLLPLCKNLHTLTLDSVAQVTDGLGDGPSQLIVLHHLHLFRVGLSAYLDDGRVLPLLFRMPSLKELEIEFESVGNTEMRDHDELYAELAQFLEASNASPSRLQMSHISITPLGLRRLLSKIPSLTHLTLHDVTFDAATFDSLTPLVSNAPDSLFLPCLEVLECFRLPKEFSHATVCSYFARRIPLGSSSAALKRLTMELATGGNPRHAAASTNTLREAGADVLIYTRQARGY